METNPRLLQLIDLGERSLSAHLEEQPSSKLKLLESYYAELRSGVRREHYPSARDLFWDDPQSTLEEKCLHDALAVFQAAREA